MEIIKKLRNLRGVSQQELSQRTGLSLSYISQLEKGKRDNVTLHNLRKISNVLSTDLWKMIKMQDLGIDVVAREDT